MHGRKYRHLDGSQIQATGLATILENQAQELVYFAREPVLIPSPHDVILIGIILRRTGVILNRREDELPASTGKDVKGVAPEEPIPFPQDYELAQAVARGDLKAIEAFLASYGGRILQTVLNWCQSSGYQSNFRLKFGGWGKLLDNVFGNDCDEVHDAYVFLLDALEHRILRAYQGRASLKVFLYPIFNATSRRDAKRNGCNYYTLFVDYVRSKHGKFVLPVWAKRLSKFDQSVYRESVWGKERWQIASQLNCEIREVEESLQRIDDGAHRAGREACNAWLVAITGTEISLSAPQDDDSDRPSLEETIPNPDRAPDICAQLNESLRLLLAALARLPAKDQDILELRCNRKLTGMQTARDLGMDLQEVYRREREAFHRLDETLSALSPKYKSLGFNELREGLRGLWGSQGPTGENGAKSDGGLSV